jgi:anti-sigma regulatory factor (Ser/Thr protein kinase)
MPANVPAAPGEASAHVDLAALPVTPSWARQFARAVLGAWQLGPDLIDTATLLISELVSNAAAATAAPVTAATSATPVHLALRHQPGALVIEVADPDATPPVLTEADLDAEAGRGLMLVQALSKEWSYFRTPVGKTVYCVISTE